MPEPIPATIAKGIVDAQKLIHPVEKSSTNQFHKYKYASGEDVLTAGRAALNTAGLALLTEGWAIRRGDENNPDAVDVSYLLCHADGSQWRPHSVETPIIPDKGRPPDKALAAALTYNIAYYLRGLLLIPRAETEAEVDKRNDTSYTPPPRAAAPPQSNGHHKPSRSSPENQPATTLNPAHPFKLFIDKTVEQDGRVWGASAAVAREAIIDCAASAVDMTQQQLRDCRDAAIFNKAMDAVTARTKDLAEAAEVFG